VGGFVVIGATFRFRRRRLRNLGKSPPFALGCVPWNIEKQGQLRVAPHFALGPKAIEDFGRYA